MKTPAFRAMSVSYVIIALTVSDSTYLVLAPLNHVSNDTK